MNIKMKQIRVAILGQGRSGRDIHGLHLKKDTERFKVAAVVEMCIRDSNTNYRGGGVHVTGKEYTYRASMEMNGGIIRNNTCNGFQSVKNFASGGGGIYISGNAQVVMNDGKIVGNTVNGGQGGGVCAIDGYIDTFPGGPNSPGAWPIEQYAQYYPAAFTMNGGEISGNSAIKGLSLIHIFLLCNPLPKRC